jgi:hypothetical protein
VAVEPIIVSYSELDTFRQCPLKHALAYKARWKKPPKEDSALAKGSLYHKVMELHFRMLKMEQDQFPKARIPESEQRRVLDNIRRAVQDLLVDHRTGEFISDVHDLIYWMWEGYVEHWRLNPEWKIMAIEHAIQIPLLNERKRASRYIIKAKLDLIVFDRENGTLWVVDHKSGANLPTQMDLEIDDQFGLYTWMMRQVGKRVQGSIHMANRTQRNKSFMPLDTRLAKTYMSRSDVELDNLALDAYFAARVAYPPKSGEVPRYSSPDPRSCGWKCDFKEVHILARKGRKMEEALMEYGFVVDKTRH